MISIDRFEEILSDLAEEIPQSFYEELNKRAYRHMGEDELTEEMRKVLRHEFRHHVEGRAGVRDLEVWDAEQIAMYKEQQADNE